MATEIEKKVSRVEILRRLRQQNKGEPKASKAMIERIAEGADGSLTMALSELAAYKHYLQRQSGAKVLPSPSNSVVPGRLRGLSTRIISKSPVSFRF